MFILSSLKFGKVQRKLIFEIKNYKTLAEGPGVDREKYLKNKISKKFQKNILKYIYEIECLVLFYRLVL